jgi:hypothetical protein
MSSRLDHLRASLARLKRARLGVRRATAWSAFGAAVLIALAGVLLLDVVFELPVDQRLVVLGLSAAGLLWAFWKFAWPFLGRREDLIELALLVERQQAIDSDLVAALQFEGTPLAHFGSPRLASTVVEHVALTSQELDVLGGVSRDQMLRRLALLSACLTLAVVAGALWPVHLAVFANRLLLGSRHYPTRTRIEQIVVNRSVTLTRAHQGLTPLASKAAEAQPLTFLVECSGRLPAGGAVQLAGIGNDRGRTRIELKALTLDERLARLKLARSKLADLLAASPLDLSPPLRDELAALARFDAADAARQILAAKKDADFIAAATSLQKAIDAWPAAARRRAIFAGELPRLNEDVTYRVSAGDAWTDPALLHVIPLPIVELQLTPIPPKYAASHAEKIDVSARQLAVLEGSSVELAAECVNHKPLRGAWLTVQTLNGRKRIALAPRAYPPSDSQRLRWVLPAEENALHAIRDELHYTLEAIDTDGLSPESPLRGTIHIRPDQPPTSSIQIVHKVVLPTAEPVISYRASDDYGVGRLAVVVEVERKAGGQDAEAASPWPTLPASAGGFNTGADAGSIRHDDSKPSIETHRFAVLPPGEPIRGDRLPLAGQYRLSLSPLKLTKGDRLKLALEVTDDRGQNEQGLNEQGQPAGVSATSEPLVVEVSDESGVLAAISQADERSEQQLTDIIKRELGIGEQR